MSQQPLPISLWLRLCRWLWKYPLPFLFSTLIINVAINIGSTWLITPTTTKAIPNTSIVGNIIGWVSAHWVFSLCLGTISVALLLVTRWGSREPASTPTMPRQVQMSVRDRERMVRRLYVRYEQSLAQSLLGAVEIELGLTSRPAAIQNAVSLSLRLPEQPEQALPAHTSILDAYNLAQQELLILGEPGAGKSMLLLKLAQHLVEQAEQDMMQPLPVVLPLSSWATKRLPLQDWLIEQFALLYNVPRQLSNDWMQAGLILPLLDGLDEMQESVRPTCMVAINTYHREHLQPLVVCSRTTEYDTAALHERLALHTAIAVQPLTLEQVDAHLAALGKPIAALRMALKQHGTLAELATTPLMLQVLMLTYHRTTIQQLSQKAPELQRQIWKAFVERMIQHKGDKQRYSLDRTCSWLKWLAQWMRQQNQTIFLTEFLQPSDLHQPERKHYGWCNSLFLALLGCLLFGLESCLLFGLESCLLGGLLGGLLSGLLFGRLEEQLSRLFGVIIDLLFEQLGSRFGGLLFGLRVAIPGWLLGGLSFGLLGGLLGGLLFGLFGWLLGVLLGVLLVGLIIGLIIGLIDSRLFEDLLDQYLLQHFILTVPQRYILQFWLWRSRLFPWQAVSFLEDATARILLRRVGKGYSFTHRLLLDYFADLDTTTPAPSPNPHPVQL